VQNDTRGARQPADGTSSPKTATCPGPGAAGSWIGRATRPLNGFQGAGEPRDLAKQAVDATGDARTRQQFGWHVVVHYGGRTGDTALRHAAAA